MKNRKVKYRTDFLLSKNGFWVGMGSVLNLAGCYFDYDYSKSDIEADRKALISDWLNVGNDIRNSQQKFKKANFNKLCLK